MWDRATFRYEMVYPAASRPGKGCQRGATVIRKKKRIPTWFSERQLAQLRETAIRLRNLNRNALSLLQHITFWRLSDKQFIDARESLGLTVTLMSSALQRRLQLVSNGRESKNRVLSDSLSATWAPTKPIPLTTSPRIYLSR